MPSDDDARSRSPRRNTLTATTLELPGAPARLAELEEDLAPAPPARAPCYYLFTAPPVRSKGIVEISLPSPLAPVLQTDPASPKGQGSLLLFLYSSSSEE